MPEQMNKKLIDSIVYLSLSSEEQKYLLPEELPICEELVLKFDEALRESIECKSLNEADLRILQSVNDLDNEILYLSNKMPKDFWFELKSLDSNEWCKIRAFAKKIVQEHALICSHNDNSKYITSKSQYKLNILPDDFITRKEIWYVLSDLFLDTDVSLFYDSISKYLKSSNYKINEIKYIFLNEVTPVLAFNVYDPAGEWAGFDSDWLARKIINHLNNKKNIFEHIKSMFYLSWPRKYAKMQWKILEPMILK